MELVKVFVFESVLMGLLSSFDYCFLDDWGWRWRFLRNDLVLAEDVIPVAVSAKVLSLDFEHRPFGISVWIVHRDIDWRIHAANMYIKKLRA